MQPGDEANITLKEMPDLIDQQGCVCNSNLYSKQYMQWPRCCTLAVGESYDCTLY